MVAATFDIPKLRAHDDGEWARMVSTITPRLHSQAGRYNIHGDRCDDFVADTWARVVAGFHTYTEGSALSTWVHSIAQNVIFDRFRTDKRKPMVFDNTVLWKRPASGAKDDDGDVVTQAMNSLNDTHRLAATLAFVHGHKYEDIALLMDLPCGTVKSRLSRAKIELAKFFKYRR